MPKDVLGGNCSLVHLQDFVFFRDINFCFATTMQGASNMHAWLQVPASGFSMLGPGWRRTIHVGNAFVADPPHQGHTWFGNVLLHYILERSLSALLIVPKNGCLPRLFQNCRLHPQRITLTLWRISYGHLHG